MGKDRIDPRKKSLPETSPDNPNIGSVTVEIDGESVVLTEAQHWVEDGEHVIVSVEFQVSSSGETFLEAFEQVIDNLFEEARSLNARIRDNEAAPNELDEALRLAERFTKIAELEECRLRELEAARLAGRRRRLNRGNRWVSPRSVRRTSGTPSVA